LEKKSRNFGMMEQKMLTITIEPSLQDRLEQVAQVTGKSTADIVIEALDEHLERFNAQKLAAEMQVYEAMYPELKQKYHGQFVAISEGQIVDSAADFETLFLRVQAQFGEWPVLIQRVGDTPIEEWHFRSPRLEQA
jgi:predicted DNA-binding protein